MAFVDVLQTTYTIQVGRTGLAFVRNDLRDLRVDAVACYSSTSLTLHSNLAQRLIAGGGAFIRAESSKHAPAEVGSAVVLPAGKLANRYLIAGVTNHLREAPSLESISAAVAAIVTRALQLDLRSLAVPVLRVGRALDADDVLRATLTPLFDCCSAHVDLTHVFIVSDIEDAPSTFDGMYRNVDAIFAELRHLGLLRAQSCRLRDLERHLGQSDSFAENLLAGVLAQQLACQQTIQHTLEQSLSRNGPGYHAIVLEFQRCRAEQARLEAALASVGGQVLRERAVGG